MLSSYYAVASDISEYQARRCPDRVAIVFGDRSLTYAQLDAQADAVADALAGMGVKKGDRLATLCRNSDRFFICLFAASKLGAVLCPVNWRLTSYEVGYILENARPTVLFLEDEFRDRITDACRAACDDLAVVSIEDGEGWNLLVDTPHRTRPAVSRGADDAVLQMYTSGTTGRPKGAMIPNRSLAKYCRLFDSDTPHWYRTSEDDVVLMMVPTFHTGGIEATLRALCAGAKVVIHSEVDIDAVLDAIETHRITDVGMVPALVQMVIEHPRAKHTDFSSLKTVFYGGSPMPIALLKRAIDVLGCGFIGLYGMTETQSAITALAPSDHENARPEIMRSVGRALPGVELKIVAPDGACCEPGTDGEIRVRSESLMKGYWGAPDTTAAVLTADGWLKTGDVGELSPDGYLYVKDRLKDMIITGGENVYSAEVEGVLFSHPDVREVAVVGVPDEKWGETVAAFVVPTTADATNADEIVAWSKRHLASYKAPKHVVFVESLPRNASGKVLKPALRDALKGR